MTEDQQTLVIAIVAVTLKTLLAGTEDLIPNEATEGYWRVIDMVQLQQSIDCLLEQINAKYVGDGLRAIIRATGDIPSNRDQTGA